MKGKYVVLILLLIPVVFISFALIARNNIPLLIAVLAIFITGALFGRYFWFHKTWDKNEHLDSPK
ncbi:MAG: hypothetical protein ACRC6H_01515 [Culicoidibacterales bacterium]